MFIGQSLFIGRSLLKLHALIDWIGTEPELAGTPRIGGISHARNLWSLRVLFR